MQAPASLFLRKLEGASKDSAVVKNTKAHLGKAVIALSLMAMKSFILKDFNFSLDRHNKAIASALVKPDNKLNVRTLKRTTKIASEVALILLVITKLKEVDEIAYVRFASVYRKFADTTQFLEELTKLLK